MRHAAFLFACSAALVAAAWWWLGGAVEMPQPPLAPGERLYCVSYAPFRGEQNPLDATTHVEPWQIEEDLARLKAITGCVRTYSIEHGLDQVPEIARRQGLKVLQGLWLSSNADKNRTQIETVVALAKRYPNVISAIVVGNEVLLRGELSATDLGNIIRNVKAASGLPVTYADVWEFWLKNRDLLAAVDFVTIHILPYWEDFPIPARTAAAHVDSIRRMVGGQLPGKDILIGEVGWPSAGRMREGALPSRSTQALVMHEVLAAAKRGQYRANLIEAFDQPWKRRLEGTVGGQWGLFASGASEPKFTWGAPVSDHPLWRWQAAGGVAFAALVFGAAWIAGRAPGAAAPSFALWLGIAATATAGGILIGLVIENAWLESFGIGGWIRSVVMVGTALAAPLVGAAALAGGVPVPAFARVLGRSADRPSDPLAVALGSVLVVTTVIALQAAFGLVFDPRYRDFPAAPLTAALVPFLVLVVLHAPMKAPRQTAETIAAATLAAGAVYIVLNEGLANWQALWFGVALVGLAFTLLRSRGVQS